MANIVESFASALAKVVAKLFSSPIDFLSGKSCSSLCGPTWDFMCYVENFCIANLLRLTLVFLLLYIDFLPPRPPLQPLLRHHVAVPGAAGRTGAVGARAGGLASPGPDPRPIRDVTSFGTKIEVFHFASGEGKG
ncbi:protein HAPLESS 2-like [Senna tora]|uniref:Protein HAPLESS 2-like n=1 Tax=Senna tora TaxID=362788 RepID=A0A834X392_9FABA|nr:protein HAPLESS 2-like [Senna tora]